MMHLKAKCDLWIASFSTGKVTRIMVWNGTFKPHERLKLLRFSDSVLTYLEKGDTLSFKAIADGSDPYAQLATRYPEWFEMITERVLSEGKSGTR